MTPRWTYTEANASRWRPLFDDLLNDAPPIEIPLEGNAKSLCSLKIRICDALKWLADGFHKHLFAPVIDLDPLDAHITTTAFIRQVELRLLMLLP